MEETYTTLMTQLDLRLTQHIKETVPEESKG